MPAAFTPTPHPVLLLPTEAQLAAMDPQQAVQVLARREELIRLEREDPLRYGYEPEDWKLVREAMTVDDVIALLGGNREGKTRCAVKLAVEDLVRHPGRAWGFFHSSEQSSINQQQPLVHQHLPPEWRNVGRAGATIYVKYAKATGFSQGKFVLPNGSTGYFWNYKQDVSVFEGYELDGVWFDELVPLPFIEALTFRVGQGRRLRILITFTPVSGYTATVARLLAGARPVRTLPAPLLSSAQVHVPGCPPGHMPLQLRGRDGRTSVFFFHLGRNPYGAGREVAARLVGAPAAKIKIRAYGWADKQVGAALPRYSPVHRITRARFQEIAARGGTRYVCADPGGTKNWFIKWYFVTPGGRTIVYREWPDFETYGEWALPPGEGQDESAGHRRFDWRPGPAQRAESGRSIREYKRLILTLEGWRWDPVARRWDGSQAEPIERRLIDPRMGGEEIPGADEGTSIIALMADEQRERDGAVAGPSLEWFAAPASRVDETVQMLNDRFDWDDTQPLGPENSPAWFVVDDLQQTHLAWSEFTGAGTDRDALKDVIDPDRYFVKADLGYVSPEMWQPRGGFAY